ncbi:MAG: tRNA 4-thiouridine(8) synthase ThiI [Spirochaetaceae bacterium]|jgi:thiamine biosynthesis protein ThiI|nr:tRNA 4-thiouridine(8) synthase ThiI [Spirochaetaceae bacterium]
MAHYLLKLGELYLKGGNRDDFVRALRRNLAQMVRGSGSQINARNGRFFVHCPDGAEAAVEDAFGRLFGITGWALARKLGKTVDAVMTACVEEGRAAWAAGARTFRIEARRADKSFPLGSQAICAQAGSAVLEAVPGFKAKMTGADAVINVEIRENAYVYGAEHKGLRGLPVGTAGRGMLLLSGGIDSPVAGFMMAGRGMRLDAVYFHAPPYTGDDALRKVERLAGIIGRYALEVRLHAVMFTEVERRIQSRAPLEWKTVLLRMAMMEAAEMIARRRKCKCLVSGESLSQVASQTVENIACTASTVTLPVFRPLIGLDKEAITRIAEKIGTYPVSILPYQDCCVLFSPEHPILRGNPAEAQRLYRQLDLDSILHSICRGGGATAGGRAGAA